MRFLSVGVVVGLALTSAVALRAAAATPSASVVRNWTDLSGRFHTTAILLDGDRTHVRLQKLHGSVITVPVARLSAADQQFVFNSLKLARVAAAPSSHDPAQPPGNPTAGSTRTSQQSPSRSAAPLDSTPLAAKPDELMADLKDGWAALASPSIGDAAAIASADRLFSQSAMQMPENLAYLRLSRAFLERLIAENVSEQEPVNDTILDSRVSGTSTTVGSSQFLLQPSDQYGLGEVLFFGSTRYNTVADAGPIDVCTSGVTRFAAAKAIRIDGQGIHLGQAATNAQTSSVVTGVSTSLPRLRGRIALRIGGRRAQEARAEAAEITAQHTAQRIDRKFDLRADERLADFWTAVNSHVAHLPADDLLRHCGWQASSTKDALHLVMLAPAGDKYPLVPAPSPMRSDAEVEVQMHVSLVRYAMTDASLQKLLRPLMVRLASMRESSSDAAPRPMIRWSDDQTWLTLSWSRATLLQAAPVRAAGSSPSTPTLATQAH